MTKTKPPALATRAAPEFDRADELIDPDNSQPDSATQVDEARWEDDGGRVPTREPLAALTPPTGVIVLNLRSPPGRPDAS